MRRKIALVMLVVVGGLLGVAAEAQAWGGYHFGYTHVGPGGVQHWGRTGFAGPYGAYSGGRYGAYGAYGGYHAGYGYGAHYGGYGGYHYGGYGYGGAYGGYRAGYYRAW
jgi:hypothetical protein